METKTVLVTGASRGIGAAISKSLAAQGFEIVLNYRSNHQAAELALDAIRQAGGSGRLLPFDVSERETAREALLADISAHGIYWGVVHNAGITADNPFPLIAGVDWDRVVGTNLNSFHHILHPLVMPMVQARRGGRIVTIASVSGLSGNRGQTHYSAAKAGLIAATRSLALELAKRNITVNSVAPGLIETDMTTSLPLDQILPHIPMRRLGKPEEVAGLVAYLFSESAAYITGQVISVNGGLV